ncbi:alpha-mannosidase [Caldicellulosiruptoraceae bacterium PP1]
MKGLEMLTYLRKFKNQNYWIERIISEIEFSYKLCEIDNNFTEIVEKAIKLLFEEFNKRKYVDEEIGNKIEEILKPISKFAKEFTIICVGHAHIDMNWMWGYHETVSVTLDTFRTVLNLMNEYKDFTFSQSQASVYKIVEEYHPKMLEEIKNRVKEGRWEIIASTWVETDKNMPNGESLARHILYTKKYISELFDIKKDDLLIDFEPDTFGHSKFVPSILNAGGVKYYYHCRGNDKDIAYRWKSPSCDEIIVYKEPFWYNQFIKPEMALFVSEFYKLYGLKHMLKVYGVGDHGGGPTRRDIETILKLNNYPIYPTIKFGTYKEFFAKLEENKEKLPIVEGELNFVFDGCFTTQSRIKMANKISEAFIEETEKLALLSNILSNTNYPSDKIEKSWHNILFSHFHDIIPGSGVIETREYAMGLFQETMATLLSQKKIALENIALNINTQSILDDDDQGYTISEGAGVAFDSNNYKISQDSRGKGKRRVFHLFNPSIYQRKDIVEITLWDWDGDIDRLIVTDAEGNIVQYQFVDKIPKDYWGHKYIKILLEAEIPSLGYSTYIIDEKSTKDLDIYFPMDPRVQKPHEFILENERIKAVFDTSSAKLISLYDKDNNIELIDSKRGGAFFRLIYEDINSGANAWVVGRYLDIFDIHKNVKVRKALSGPLRNSIVFDFEFGNSSNISVQVILDKNSKMLKFVSEVDFKEIADLKKGIIPQLSFYVPLSFESKKYLYDIPFGVIERTEYDLDVPGLTFACAKSDKNIVALFSKSKYAYRSINNSISLTLIRSSHEPDPYPEFGKHKIEFALFTDNIIESNRKILNISYDYNHDINVINNSKHEGKLPLKDKLLDFESNSTVISAIKKAEFGERKLVIRLYEADGKQDFVKMTFNRIKPIEAYSTDINEEKINSDDIEIKQNSISLKMKEYGLKTIIVKY